MLQLKLLTRLEIQFSHLNEHKHGHLNEHKHKYRHGFGDTINAMCACGSEAETTEHFLLKPIFILHRD